MTKFYYRVDTKAWDMDFEGPFPTLQAARDDTEKFMPNIIEQFGGERPDDRKFEECEPDYDHGTDNDDGRPDGIDGSVPIVARESMFTYEVHIEYFKKG